MVVHSMLVTKEVGAFSQPDERSENADHEEKGV